MPSWPWPSLCPSPLHFLPLRDPTRVVHFNVYFLQLTFPPAQSDPLSSPPAPPATCSTLPLDVQPPPQCPPKPSVFSKASSLPDIRACWRHHHFRSHSPRKPRLTCSFSLYSAPQTDPVPRPVASSSLRIAVDSVTSRPQIPSHC